MRVMLDSMIHDALAADAGTKALLERLVRERKITLLTTSIQGDELADIPDADRRARVMDLPAERVPTSIGVWDVSRWDEAEWGTDDDHAAFDALKGGNLKHVEDALIGVTAAAKVDLLVTEDKTLAGRLRREQPQLRVIGFKEFALVLLTLMASMPS